MKTYTITVTIEEGNDEFWEDINHMNASGCDTVVDLVRDALIMYGGFDSTNTKVELQSFKK